MHMGIQKQGDEQKLPFGAIYDKEINGGREWW